MVKKAVAPAAGETDGAQFRKRTLRPNVSLLDAVKYEKEKVSPPQEGLKRSQPTATAAPAGLLPGN